MNFGILPQYFKHWNTITLWLLERFWTIYNLQNSSIQVWNLKISFSSFKFPRKDWWGIKSKDAASPSIPALPLHLFALIHSISFVPSDLSNCHGGFHAFASNLSRNNDQTFYLAASCNLFIVSKLYTATKQLTVVSHKCQLYLLLSMSG